MKQCKEAIGLMNCELLLSESISGNWIWVICYYQMERVV